MIESKVIVITGASSGIGAQLAQVLGAEGHRLVLGARRLPELEAVAARSGPSARALKVDVTRRKDVEELRDVALKDFGRIDVWINNAGRGITKSVMDLRDEDIDDMILVNTKSALYGMQAAVPVFKKQGEGHLINISSFLARVPMASVRSAYSASKAALNSLTTNLRMDLAQGFPRIHVSIVMPGIVLTDFAKNAGNTGPSGLLPSGPMKAQSVDEAAQAIATLIREPHAELYTNPASAQVARAYFESVGAF